MRALVYPASLAVYARLGVAGWAFHVAGQSESPSLGAAGLLVASRLLDLADGALARRFGQTSTFGTVADLVADLATHTIVWSLSGLAFAWPLVALEWAAGGAILACTFRRGRAWKDVLTARAPAWVRRYFANNQRNLLCGLATVGHFGVPALAYLDADPILLAAFAPGLILYEAVTVYLLLDAYRERFVSQS